MKHHGCRWLVALALASWVTSAHAQSKPPPPPGAPSSAPTVQASSADPARTLFEEGTEALNAGKFGDAIDKLQAAWRLKKSYDVAANLGAAYHKLGMHATAAGYLSLALREYPVGAKPSVKKWLEELLADAKRDAVTIKIEVNVNGADVIMNGESYGKSPIAHELYLTPGLITVDATKEGYERARAQKDGAKGSSVQMSLALQPRTESGTTQRPRWPTFAGGGLAVALAGVGIGLAVGAGEKASAADEKLEEIRATPNAGPCPAAPSTGLCAELADLNRGHDQMRNASIGMFVGAGVVAAAAAAYTLWARSGPVRAGVTVGPRGSGLLVQGSF